MIPVTLLEIHISAPHPLDFGANPGSSIRGALYEALRAMYDTGAAVQSRHDIDQNPVAWLLRLEDEGTSGGKDVPRPIAIRPPLDTSGLKTSFGVSLYGRGRDHLNLVLSGLYAMQRVGMGRGRNRFQIDRIDTLDPITYQAQPLMDGAGKALGSVPNAPPASAYVSMASALASDALTVEFLTPTRIIAHDKLCHQPIFKAWAQRLLERTRLLAELYTDDPVWIPFKELNAAAESIRLMESQTRWVEAQSGSNRDGLMRPTSGFVGRARYKGDLSKLMTWLVLGQALQVGKNTVKGCGWYRLVYQWG